MERTNNPALVTVRNGQYDPKMTEQQRCSALALFINGASWRQVAAFFGVHYRTAQQIGNGPAYKSVRLLYDKMGRDAFTKEYLSEETIASFNKWMKDNAKTFEELAEKQTTDPANVGWKANKMANGKRGEHNVRSEDDGTLITIHVKWIDATAETKPGWFWSVPLLSTGQVGPYATSTDAFDGSKRVWDHANYRPRPQDLQSEPIPAVVGEPEALSEMQQAVTIAKTARFNMEQKPTREHVNYFARVAMNVFRIGGISDVRDQFSGINWRGFDPTPYLDEPYASWYNMSSIREDDDHGTHDID